MNFKTKKPRCRLAKEEENARTQEETSALETAYTQYNARIDTHGKPSRTPGNVPDTVLYDAIFYLTGQLARTSIVRANPARCIGNPFFFFWFNPYEQEHENTR